MLNTNAIEPWENANLLRNPDFSFFSNNKKSGHNVAYWNTDSWKDIKVINKKNSSNIVVIKPGKRFWQFANLPELKLKADDKIYLSVSGEQHTAGALEAHLALMLIESADGTWAPKEYGYKDQRTFQRHGRGELIRSPDKIAVSGNNTGSFTLDVGKLTIDPFFVTGKDTSSAGFRNVIGVLVEFVNRSNKDITIYNPILSKGNKASELKPSRPMAEYYRQIPRTIEKLKHGKPINILTLGSSIDRGSANPPFYPYDENHEGPNFKEPLGDANPFVPQLVGRQDLDGYVGWWQHYYMYTSRMRLELMRKYNYKVEDILLNVMACGGTCIGESHSGFLEYANFVEAPNPNTNGHADSSSWEKLYPDFFKKGKIPLPDLIIFGHGHNEHIDRPDEIAAYEGAIRWFQRHYPGVEFACCMWIRDKGEKNSMFEPMKELTEHFDIPFIDVGQMITDLRNTCNYNAIAPDGGHPQAASHYLWFKQIEQLFEIPGNPKKGIPQRQFPQRLNKYSYGWEGDIVKYNNRSARLKDGKMMIIDDCTFNIWASHNSKEDIMKILIDNNSSYEDAKGQYAGRGKNMSKRDNRNSTFVYGRLNTGDRHIFEIVGDEPIINAVDNKVCTGRTFISPSSEKWRGDIIIEDFNSEWGAPYGKEMFKIPAGKKVEIDITANLISIAYLDLKDGGKLEVIVDGEKKLVQETNIPFVDSEGVEYFIENRKAISGIKYGKHNIEIKSIDKDIYILGVYEYDTNSR